MEKLSDFKPLERVVLPELGELDCSGLILVVGPNSCGKTQFLRDLYERIKGDPRKLVVARDIRLRKPELDPFLSCLEREGYLASFVDEAGTRRLRPMASYVGTGEAAQQIALSQAQPWHQAYPEDTPDASPRRNEFLVYFGRFVVTTLFLERRLLAVNQVPVIDFEIQPLQQDLQALYLNDAARAELLVETENTFGKGVWPDTSRGTILSLKVGTSRGVPTAEDRLSPQKMLRYRTIESEGDGLKSYVATCIALLLGRRPVCLVDEPEMCLHPPQAYNLGRFVGRFGSSSDRVTFVATHSSQVLRGVIEAAPEKLQIVRLVRRGEAFEAHLVQSAMLAEALRKPALRAESVLDGIFSQAVVVVEADTDRTVYQATKETLQEETHLDIHFSTVGGSGGIADTCHLYRTLKIPIAVIADLDLLVDPERLRRVLERLADAAEVEPLVRRAADIGSQVKLIPPTLSAENVQRRLKSVLSAEMDWSKGHDLDVCKQMREVANELDRMKRLKSGGIASLPAQLQGPVNDIVQGLARHGLFLVPVGELEQWFGQSEVSVSRQNKWAWANDAAAYIRNSGPRHVGVWEFISEVAGFLSQ
jgi:OLD-like protein